LVKLLLELLLLLFSWHKGENQQLKRTDASHLNAFNAIVHSNNAHFIPGAALYTYIFVSAIPAGGACGNNCTCTRKDVWPHLTGRDDWDEI